MKNHYFIIIAIALLLNTSGFYSYSQTKIITLPENGIFKDSIKSFSGSLVIQRNLDSKKPPFLVIQQPIYINATKVISGLDFYYTTLEKIVDVNGVEVKEFVNSFTSKFLDDATFYRVHFNKGANFFSNEFKGDVYCKFSYFNNEVSFTASTFEKSADFSRVIFDKYVDFSNTNFKGDLNFDGVELPNVMNLIGAKFDRLDLRYTSTFFLKHNKNKQENLSWDNISRKIGADIVNMKEGFSRFAHDSIIYYQSKKIGKCAIKLLSTNIEKLLLPYDKFFVDTSFYSYESKSNLYSQLIKNCEEAGMTDSVEGWTIEYEKLKNIHKLGEGTGATWNTIQNLWWGFGYKRWRIVLSAVIIFLTLAFVNAFLLNTLLKKVYYIPDLSKNFLPSGTNTANKLITHLNSNNWLKTFGNKFVYSLHYTGVIYFGLKVNHEALNIKTPLIIYFYFIYLVGVFHLAGIITYILQIDPI